MLAIEFIHDCNWQEIPDEVRGQARRCLLDTIGASVGGRQTELSQIIRDFAASVYHGEGAQIWLDGRSVSPPGAALANGMTVDALDIHDGHNLTKGHAGAALVPALLASVSLYRSGRVSGKDLLSSLVVGYEVALRAGLALHGTACDYHTSGAWNALGCAAIAARFLGLTTGQTRHAIGIAEYHGPRSQMMRCIDHPTMLKDGSGWGAMTGVSASMLAHAGFTGAPALTVESAEAVEFWSDLGEQWLINDQYFKPYAVCRWAQPAVVGALNLRRREKFSLEAIKRLRIITFHEAVRLACRRPETTEEAQYSLPFPVAAALAHQRLGPAQLSSRGLFDPMVLQLAERVELVEDPGFSRRFPAERIAQVEIELFDGTRFDSGEVEATWGVAKPPTDEALREKFRWLAGSSLVEERAKALEEMIWKTADLPDASQLIELLAPPPNRARNDHRT